MMKLSLATSVLAASVFFVTKKVTATATALQPKNVLGEFSALESRSLQGVTYTSIGAVSSGTKTDACNYRRYSKISDDRRLAAMDCDANYGSANRIHVYAYDDSTSAYISTPIFTTTRSKPSSAFGFSPDGKTVVIIDGQSGCDGIIFNEDSSGSWLSQSISFFPCDGSIPGKSPAFFEMGTNYDGTMIAVGSGYGAVRVFEKQPNDSWDIVLDINNGAGRYEGIFMTLSRDGKKILWNDNLFWNDRPNNVVVLKYAERNDDGSWTSPITVPSIAGGDYWVRGYFTPDGSRIAVNSGDGVYILDYDNAGSWTVVKNFTNGIYSASDGNGIVDISDNGKRVIYCGMNMGSNTIATFDENIDGSWSTSLWGDIVSYAGCTIDGSGGLMVVSMINDGDLVAYRDNTIGLIQPTPAPTLAPTLEPSLAPSLVPSITLPQSNEWYIDNFGEATAEIESSDIIMVSLPFNASNRVMGAEVYLADCVTEFVNSESLFAVATTEPTSSQPDGFVQFNTTLGLNITALNATSYWNDFTDGTQGGWVKACVETSLQFNDLVELGNGDADQDVVFKNNIVNVSISLTTNFTVENLDIQREVATEQDVDTDYSEFIRAFECEDDNLYSEISTPITYNQGDIITICVTDESSDIVQVEEFFNLKVSQTGRSDYNFITNSLWNPEITTPMCVDGVADGTGTVSRRVCYAKIRALALFFEELDAPNLIISGSVFVVRDGRRVRRNLHMTLPGPKRVNEQGVLDITTRRAMEDGDGSGGFEVAVVLNGADDSATPGRTGGATVTGLVSIAVGAAGIALVV